MGRGVAEGDVALRAGGGGNLSQEERRNGDCRERAWRPHQQATQAGECQGFLFDCFEAHDGLNCTEYEHKDKGLTLTSSI